MLLDKLEEVAEVNIGQPMLFTWVEAVREFLEDRKRSQENEEDRHNSRIGMTEVDIIKMVFLPEFDQGLQWVDQTAVKTVRAPDRTARFGTP